MIGAREPPTRAAEATLKLRPAITAIDRFETRLRQAVGRGLEQRGPRVDGVAASLSLTRAQLLRRLAQRRIDFNATVRDIRRERALSLLTDPGLPLTDIALMLGYSELSAFSRAFRGWTGVSPLQYRRTVAAPEGEAAVLS